MPDRLNPIPDITPDGVAEFHARVHVDPGSDCWLWRGLVSNGVPRFYCRGLPARTTAPSARRVAWVMSGRGEPARRLRSMCGVRLCVNPDHATDSPSTAPGAASSRAYSERHAAAGLCRNCSRPAVRGVYCEKHSEGHRNHQSQAHEDGIAARGDPVGRISRNRKE